MGLDFLLYVFMVTILIVLAVVAAKFYGMLGAFGGLIGAVFTYMAFTSDTLILNTVYDPTAQAFVSQSVDMGFFSWILLILTVFNFVVVLKK